MKTSDERVTAETDKQLLKLKKKMAKVYTETEKELRKEIDAYFAAFEAEDKKKTEELEAGTITKEQYKQWRIRRMTTGSDYERIRDKIARAYMNANVETNAMINDEMMDIFSEAHNEEAYQIEMAVNKSNGD